MKITLSDIAAFGRCLRAFGVSAKETADAFEQIAQAGAKLSDLSQQFKPPPPPDLRDHMREAIARHAAEQEAAAAEDTHA